MAARAWESSERGIFRVLSFRPPGLSLSLSLSLGNTGGNPIMKRLNSSSQ